MVYLMQVKGQSLLLSEVYENNSVNSLVLPVLVLEDQGYESEDYISVSRVEVPAEIDL